MRSPASFFYHLKHRGCAVPSDIALSLQVNDAVFSGFLFPPLSTYFVCEYCWSAYKPYSNFHVFRSPITDSCYSLDTVTYTCYDCPFPGHLVSPVSSLEFVFQAIASQGIRSSQSFPPSIGQAYHPPTEVAGLASVFHSKSSTFIHPDHLESGTFLKENT